MEGRPVSEAVLPARCRILYVRNWSEFFLREETANMNNVTQVRRARLAAFAAAQATAAGGVSSALQISALRNYPLREPVSGRSYTVIKVQARGGLEGYGECGSVTPAELAQALKIV